MAIVKRNAELGELGFMEVPTSEINDNKRLVLEFTLTIEKLTSFQKVLQRSRKQRLKVVITVR